LDGVLMRLQPLADALLQDLHMTLHQFQQSQEQTQDLPVSRMMVGW
jgi:hypothetical protein